MKMHMKKSLIVVSAVVLSACGGNNNAPQELTHQEDSAVEAQLKKDELAMDSLEQLIMIQVEDDSTDTK